MRARRTDRCSRVALVSLLFAASFAAVERAAAQPGQQQPEPAPAERKTVSPAPAGAGAPAHHPGRRPDAGERR